MAGRKLFLGNLPHKASISDVETWIAEQGVSCEQVEIIADRVTGQPRGFGFATLRDGVDVDDAIARLNGTRLSGRTITVNHAAPRTGRHGA